MRGEKKRGEIKGGEEKKEGRKKTDSIENRTHDFPHDGSRL